MKSCEEMIYTSGEMAEMLGVSLRTFYRRIGEGKIPRGRWYPGEEQRLYWKFEDFDKLVESVYEGIDEIKFAA